MSGIGRRQFILLAASVPLLGALASCTDASTPAEARLADLVADPERAGRLGVAAAQTLGTPDIGEIADRLLVELRDGVAIVPDPARFEDHIARAIAADYRAGNTVVVDGWLLSTTEAGLAALLGDLEVAAP